MGSHHIISIIVSLSLLSLSLQINVRATGEKKPFLVWANSSTTVDELKMLIDAEIGVPPQRQQLFIGAYKALISGQSLSEYNAKGNPHVNCTSTVRRLAYRRCHLFLFDNEASFFFIERSTNAGHSLRSLSLLPLFLAPCVYPQALSSLDQRYGCLSCCS